MPNLRPVRSLVGLFSSMNLLYDSPAPITHTFITDTSLTINLKHLAAKPDASIHANFDEQCNDARLGQHFNGWEFVPKKLLVH